MALKVKFADSEKTEVVYLNALETEEYYNGSSRRTLTFEIDRAGVNLETLDLLCTEGNITRLELENTEEGITNIYDGYVLKLKLGVETVPVDPEQMIFTERVILKLGKRTYIEQKLHELGI